MTRYSNAFWRVSMALGMSLISKEYVVFHPWSLLYLFWKATFLIFTVFPLCWSSFSKTEASTAPAWNFFFRFGHAYHLA